MTAPNARQTASLSRSLLALVLSGALTLPAHATGPCVIAEPSPPDTSGYSTPPPIPREAPGIPAPRLQAFDQFLSSPEALGRMIVIEGAAEAATAAAAIRSALPAIDIGMALAEVGQTIRENAPAGRPPPGNPVLVRLLPADPARTEAEAEAGCTRDLHDCSVELFEAFWRSASPEQLAFTLAHELFHIAQALAYPGTTHPCTDWWGEGTAEWFANHVFHRQPYTGRSGFLRDWDRRSLHTSLTNLDYEAVAFFFWAAERFGPGYPLTLGAFGDQGLGAARRLGAFLSPEDWANFASVLLDGALRYPDGRPALPEPTLGPVMAVDGGIIMLTGELLSLPRQRVTVEPGLWRFELTGIETGSVVVVGGESGGWDVLRNPGEAVSRFFGCAGGGEIVIAAAGGTGEATGATFAVTREEGDCNSCLIGAWTHLIDRSPDPEEIAIADRMGVRWVQILGGHAALIQGLDMPLRVQFRQRYPVLTLRPDGRFRYDDPRVLTLEGTDDGGEPFLWQVFQHMDSVQGEWRDVRGRLMMRGGEVHVREYLRVESPHLSFSHFFDNRRPAPLPFANGMTIQCSGRTLVLDYSAGPGLPLVVQNFERVN